MSASQSLPEEAGVNHFAFVIHPLSVQFIHQHPWFRWTRNFPDGLIEAIGAFFPPIYLGRITGGQSPETGQRIEGYLYSLGATPRQMLRRSARLTYWHLNRVARMAERRGARILGLGAFTSVVGDAGVTVAHQADIAITTGNSLTVAATLEASRQAVVLMGAQDLAHCRVMVIGATGSIGSVCARLLARTSGSLVLIGVNPGRLADLQKVILAETPVAQVTAGTRANDLLVDCDLVITATSALGQRILDITRCKPGAVICDVALPPDVSAAEAALREDVLVIESGEVVIPGNVDFGYDIALPPGTAYACLAETMLLALEGRFEDFTLGRTISLEQVEEIYRLFKKHRFQLAGLRSFGKCVTGENIAKKRLLADELRADPERFRRLQGAAAQKLERIPVAAKRVGSGRERLPGLLALGASAGMLWLLLRCWRTRKQL